MVRAETVRLRTAPGKKGKMAALLDAGRVAKVVDHKDGWVKLQLATGTEGWVRSDLVSINKKRTKDRGAFVSQADRDAAERHARRAQLKKAHAEAELARAEAAHRKALHEKALHAKAVHEHQMALHQKALHAQKLAQLAKAAAKKKQALLAAKAKAAHAKALAKATPVKPVVTVAAVSTPSSAARAALADRPLTLVTAPVHAEEKPAVIEAVAPREEIAVSKPEVAETVAPVVTLVAPKRVKGGVAPAVRVPIVRASKRGDRIVSRALSYRGVPYRMGATGRGAFDCSGFTRYVLNQSGEALPRTAAEQYRRGESVSKSELRPGDLVFFKNTYKHGVSHVGIYMGNNKFVHASSHGGVRTNSLDESYYVHHWAGARRPRVIQGE